MILTHQAEVDARVANRRAALLSTATPSAVQEADQLQVEADELSAKAEAFRAEKFAALRRIEVLLQEQSRDLGAIDHLRGLAGIAGSIEANGKQALEYYIAARQTGDAYGQGNFDQLTSMMLRASVCAPMIPAAISEREKLIASAKSEVQQLATSHGVNLPALIESIKAQRGLHAEICYVATLNRP